MTVFETNSNRGGATSHHVPSRWLKRAICVLHYANPVLCFENYDLVIIKKLRDMQSEKVENSSGIGIFLHYGIKGNMPSRFLCNCMTLPRGEIPGNTVC